MSDEQQALYDANMAAIDAESRRGFIIATLAYRGCSYEEAVEHYERWITEASWPTAVRFRHADPNPMPRFKLWPRGGG